MQPKTVFRAFLVFLMLLVPGAALAGMNGPVCKSNPCTLNYTGGWQNKWFARVDAYVKKGVTFRTLPSKSKDFYGQFGAWMNGSLDTWPTGFCTSACAMTAGKLYKEGRIKIDPNTWLCYCHTGTDYVWHLLATADAYDGKWFSALLSGKPFKLKDVQ